MNRPIIVSEYYDYDTEQWEENLYPIPNCTECVITETENDFQAKITITDPEVNDYEGCEYLYLRAVLRLKHSDGNYYDFKVDSLSSSDGVTTATAKYRAYEFGGVINEPVVGMYTPKGVCDYINTHTHGIPIRSQLSSDIDDEFFGIAETNPQAVRTTIYNQVVGATKCILVPHNGSDLKLVRSRGRETPIVISTKACVSSLSVDENVPSKPSSLIAYIKNEDGYNGPIYAVTGDDEKPGEGELYDATEEFSGFVDYDEDWLEDWAREKLKEIGTEEDDITVRASLTKESPMIQVGDHVVLDDDMSYSKIRNSWGETVSLVVKEIEYDSLNDCMVSITAGSIPQDISDVISSQEKTIESYSYAYYGYKPIYPGDLDEDNRITFNIEHYNDGDVITWTVDGNSYYGAKIVSIEGNSFTYEFNIVPEHFVSISWFMYYIQRKSDVLYDNGDLCDHTWSNANSAITFAADSISFAGSSSSGRACIQQEIELASYSRLVIEYSFTTWKAVKVGFNTTSSTTTTEPNMFLCSLVKGATKCSVDIPEEYTKIEDGNRHTGYLKIVVPASAVGQITKIYLQSK